MAKVFVYGTLRRGQGANHFLDQADYLGECRLDIGSLYHTGWYPAYKAKGNTGVVGEVYSVTESMIEAMDLYEGHPNLFERKLIDTPLGEAFIYEYQGNVSGCVRVEHGDWVRDYGEDTQEVS